MNREVAREILRRALELHVVEGDEVPGTSVTDPEKTLERLTAPNSTSFLTAGVRDALERLVALRPRSSTAQGTMGSLGGSVDLKSQTLAPDAVRTRSDPLNLSTGTISPDEKAQDPLNLHQSTLAPDEEDDAGGGAPIDLQGRTAAPDRDFREAKSGEKASRGDKSQPPGTHATFTPDRTRAPSSPLDLAGKTSLTDRDEPRAGGLSATFVPDRDAPGQRIPKGATFLTDRSEAAPGMSTGATWVPDRESDRQAPGLDLGEETGAVYPANQPGMLTGGTWVPDRSGPRKAMPAGLDLSKGTAVPDRDEGQTFVGSRAGGTHHPAASTSEPTYVADREGGSERKFDLQGATEASERADSSSGRSRAKSGVADSLGLDQGTIAPDDEGAPSTQSTGGTRATLSPAKTAMGNMLETPTFTPDEDAPPAAAPGRTMGGLDPALDLGILDTPDRETIEDAAFCRVAVRMKFLTVDQIRGLERPPEVRISEHLVAAGLLETQDAAEIVEARLEPQTVCPTCVVVLRHQGATCSKCGQRSPTTETRPSRQTSTGGRTKTKWGIEGFPGAGGNFAGYELLEHVAEGGMGVVFKARQATLNRVVALKVMRGGNLASKARRQRFLREAEAAAALKHPGIVPVHEIDEVSGYPFYTMDFVEGPPLGVYVKERSSAPREVAILVKQIAEAVQHFHLHGIIHRDLKPENILVGTDSTPRIIDFGIAKKMGHERDSSTIEGDILGTPHYMSPEQAAGRVREVDTRTDVYALGAILYELLTGAAPFKELASHRLVIAIQEDDPDPVSTKNPSVDSDIEAIVGKAMAKERERRYQSAADLALDLERYVQNLPISARPATIVYRLRKYVRRRLPAVVASGVVFVVLTGTLLFALEARAQKLREQAEHEAEVRKQHEDVQNLIAQSGNPNLSYQKRVEMLLAARAREPNNTTAQQALDALRAQEAALQNQEKEKAAEEFIAQAQDASRPYEERVELLNKAIAGAPDGSTVQKTARNSLDRLQGEHESAENEKRKKAADAEARAKARQAALAGVESADREKDPLSAINYLRDALVLVPAGDGELRTTVEKKLIELALGQSKDAIDKNDARFAGFWLGGIEKLPSKTGYSATIDELTARLRDLTNGENTFKKAKEDAAKGDYIAAQAEFKQAREQGIAQQRIDQELAVIAQKVGASVQELVGQGREKLTNGHAADGLASAQRALSLDPNFEAAKALAADCALTVFNEARKKAAEESTRSEGRQLALVELANAAATLAENAKLSAVLKREHDARQQLLNDPSLAGLVYVPEIQELDVRPLYIQRTEVTNADFKRFVDDGGYKDTSLWDAPAVALLDKFRDGTPGGNGAPGPRSWTGGGFGDPANADRPVRGVTVYEARAYANWLTRKSGGTAKWRLPTESEWEVAAGWDPILSRLQKYPWGDDFDGSRVPIGTDLPGVAGSSDRDVSKLGVSDAGGNVYEWVERPSRPDKLPGIKKSAYPELEEVARRSALIHTTGSPGLLPPVELLGTTGFRLVREVN
jgi:tRNA A-37 threonylcarbamoyl transferase component Bud32